MGIVANSALRGSSGQFIFLQLLAIAFCAMLRAAPALAEEAAATCEPVVARVVSIQGTVEIRRRAGAGDWLPISRLDTSICAGDLLRTGAAARAAIYVQSETLVRVDRNTTIALTQTPDETVVEFFQDAGAQSAADSRSCGAGYFISRFPKKLKVNSPYLNAAIEGTEFQMALQCSTTELAVIEGAVRARTASSGEERVLTNGESLVAGASTPAVFKTLIKPTDAVEWVLYYPPLSETSADGEIPTVAQCRGLQSPADQSCLTHRAESFLRRGQSADALRAIDETLASDSANPDANALRAIVQIAVNNVTEARKTATAATTSGPNEYRTWLALSYAQQAAFDLDAALVSAQRAEALQPTNALTNARVAELLLSLGRTSEAEKAAQEAVRANPAESLGQTMLGFVHLAQINTKAAREDFEAAIQNNSFEPLPRLGLGLVIIREGQLVQGREQLEIAVALDPSSSLLRSYVGKAYYEENTRARDGLAATQFELAKKLDPNDPTPWFYDAMLLNTQTRPVEALGDLNKSADLNDDRAVYRSRLLLDQDLAARNASQATIYNELGFDQLGLTTVAESLAVDPGNGSAHRFLADIDATLPRHEIARASELLQAQLRQPLGAPPLQAQLANDIAFKNAFFGPATVGLNEFNPLFIQDGQDLQLFGVVGDNDTYGDQVIVNGLRGPVSFSLSQFVAHSDGYRENNDDTLRQYDGFVQAQLSTRTSAQIEVTRSTQRSGDLQSTFDPALFADNVRNKDSIETQRFGLRQVVDSQSDILLSIVRQDRHASAHFDDPFFPVTVNSDQQSWKTEAQYLTSRAGMNLLVGASDFTGNNDEEVITPFFTEPNDFGPNHVNAYTYLYIPSRGAWPQFQVGVSYDALHSDVGDQSKFNPKFGAIWKVTDVVTLRAAGFRVLKRRINSDQGLEPTQLAGFNQFFDDRNGTVSDVGGLAADFAFSPTVAAGLEFTRRKLKVPYFNSPSDVFFQYQTEDTASGYLNWLPSQQLSVSFQPDYQDFKDGTTFKTLKLAEFPLAVRYFHASGVWMGVSVTGVNETGEFSAPTGNTKGSDDFWLVDAILAYRFPQRLGTVSFQVTNLFSQNFQFQEIDQVILPRYVPEAQALLRISINI